ncbi:MAG: purine-nucleoside phosphorylase [Chloroflexi bacterium]|nr:purine-nucleoside phosphorylase [Chloroflexota bacterium]
MNQYSRQDYERVATFIMQHTRYRPKVAFILGSGLSGLADAVENPDILPYGDIPEFPRSSVEGHAGRLVLGELEGREVWVMQGRVHFYEGLSLQQITFPIRVMRAFGVDALILTNAAGGLNPSFRPGDVMLIEDQINLVGLIGHNPLMGPNDPELGPRFPDMSSLYDRKLRLLAIDVAERRGIVLQRGVYVGLAGPAYETPAEVRFLRAIGADATGMSTTNEALVARHCGMRVFGLSGITNAAIDQIDSPRQTTHEEVLEAGAIIIPKMTAILRGMLARWDEAVSA